MMISVSLVLIVKLVLVKLRKYQKKYVKSDYYNKVIVAPTGAGKTVIIAEIIKREGCRILFLADQIDLIKQACKMLNAFSIKHGVIKAGIPEKRKLKVQVASPQTLKNRKLPKVDLILVDETHVQTHNVILDMYPNTPKVGFTATPIGKHLARYYDGIIEHSTTKKLIKKGFLVKYRYYSSANVPTVKEPKAGDYNTKDLDEAFNNNKLIGEVVSEWKRLGENRKTVVFCSNVNHAKALCAEFNDRGIKAVQVDGSSDARAREASRDYKVICNADLYNKGWDYPEIACVILACKTKSIVKYRQRCGRGFRICKGKKDLIIIDHGFNFITQEGMFPDTEVTWSLEAPVRPKDKEPVRLCPLCFFAYSGGDKCPSCGKNTVATSDDGTIVEFKRALEKINTRLHHKTLAEIEGEELAFFRARIEEQIAWGYNPMYPVYKFKEHYDKMPPRWRKVKLGYERMFKGQGWEKGEFVKGRFTGWKKTTNLEYKKK